MLKENMNYNNYSSIFIILMIVLSIGCKGPQVLGVDKVQDNLIIKNMYLKDIEIRELDAKTDTVNLEDYDKVHRKKIFELLAANQVITPMDKYRASLILQHTAGKICEGQLVSMSAENYLLAFHLSSAALGQLKLNSDTTTIKKNNIPRMVALNYDRYLLFTKGFQKFGTQFVFDENGAMLLAPVDSTLSNDEERKEYNVQPLSLLLSRYKMKAMPAE